MTYPLDSSQWTYLQVACLCELMANGSTFEGCAYALGKSKSAVFNRWKKIRKEMGSQAV